MDPAGIDKSKFRTAVVMLGVMTWLAGAPSLQAQDSGADKIDFNRDIRPILTGKCTVCHGGVKRKAGLSFLTRDDALAELESGEKAVIPGQPQNSEMIRRVTTGESDELMPPEGEPLTDAQVGKLKKWIQQGATYPKHWSFLPVSNPKLPAVKQKSWPRNAIDHFILTRLEAQKLTPSASADRYTLIRRLSLDLTGLPPSPSQVDQFINDKRPDAYERLVDRLLQSPHYGERWAKHWLDQARYADSNGYSIDSPRSMWPWRNWVISAINSDMPFDQFTIEQIAGDLLPNATQEQRIATGFHRNTLVNQEGGSDREQFRNEAVVDRVNTTGQVWLGLTVGCVQCHNHPYDPVEQREFYQMFAFFNSDEDANSTGPTISIASDDINRERKALGQQIAAGQKALAAQRKKSEAAQRKWEASIAESKAVQWRIAKVKAAKSQIGATLSVLNDGSILATGPNKPHDTYSVDLNLPDHQSRLTAIRLDLLTDPSLPRKGPGRAGNGNIVLSGFKLQVAAKAVAIGHAYASHQQSGYPVSATIDGKDSTGWAINGGGKEHPLNGPHHAVYVLRSPLKLDSKTLVRVELQHRRPDNASYQIGRFRISVASAAGNLLASWPRALRDAARTPLAKRTASQKKLLGDTFAKQDTGQKQLIAKVDQLKKKLKDLDRKTPTAMVMRALAKPRTTHVHRRGDFLRKGDQVEPNVPAILPEMKNAAKLPTRLDLARWLVSEDNPLTARVTVNRIWMRYFGRGLVETENDFGSQGTLPTHPQLLDFLAHEFMKGKWSLKKLHRLIVTSATYRQSSRVRQDLKKADPRNNLLGRQNRLRVEAEIIRDQALIAAGVMDARIGGPSVYPPQPEGIYAFTQRKQSWKTSTSTDRYRRGMYIFFYRSAPYPMLTTFDTPDFTTTCTRRLRSNTPLQSLTLANDQAFFELAQALALRVLKHEDQRKADRMTHAFRLCLVRPPTSEEHSRLIEFLNTQLKRFGKDLEAAGKIAPANRPADISVAEAAAWTSVARVLMNLDEFVTRE